ncbi:hypothetical protein [Scytonema hofmannii]|nr:hypothetical protein [Scytonema hofmannii]
MTMFELATIVVSHVVCRKIEKRDRLLILDKVLPLRHIFIAI